MKVENGNTVLSVFVCFGLIYDSLVFVKEKTILFYILCLNTIVLSRHVIIT